MNATTQPESKQSEHNPAVPLSPEEQTAAARLRNQSATCRSQSRRLWRDLENQTILPIILPY